MRAFMRRFQVPLGTVLRAGRAAAAAPVLDSPVRLMPAANVFKTAMTSHEQWQAVHEVPATPEWASRKQLAACKSQEQQRWQQAGCSPHA